VDFTPMVDMNMLLITFFMLCTSLSKPQTMEINMPSNDKKITEQDKNAVGASHATTLLLAGGDSIFYYTGLADYTNYKSLKQTSYAASGLRAFLLKRNAEVVAKIEDLKQKKLNLKISQADFTKRSSEIKNAKNTPVVIIKATDRATYKNLIDALDEMQICSIGVYVIDSISKGDRYLMKNLETKGAYAQSGASAK
jgi:biopolymer transport protein ExbD